MIAEDVHDFALYGDDVLNMTVGDDAQHFKN